MAELFTNTYSPPEWVDQNFLQAALRQGLRRESLNVNTCTIKPGTNVGDNYLSQMFRASASVSSRRKGAEDMSVVIKSMPRGDAVEKFVTEAKFFSREASMLSKTLPLLHRILNTIGGPKLFADLYYLQEKPSYTLVLEDLCQSGFGSADRLNGLDLHHATLVVESLAVFHASSLIAVQEDETIKETYFSSYWQKPNEKNIQKFVSDGINSLLDCLETWDNFPKDLPDRLKNLKVTAVEKLFDATERRCDKINVLNHGDPWTSNFMFKYSKGFPIELRFVDFQLSCYNSPVYDLLYFLFTSPENDIKISRMNDLLQSYHNKLTETCEKLNYPLNFSLGDLREDFFRRLFFGFVVSVVLLPFMVVPSKDVTDLNDFLDADKGHSKQIYLNETYRKAMELFIPFFSEHGIL